MYSLTFCPIHAEMQNGLMRNVARLFLLARENRIYPLGENPKGTTHKRKEELLFEFP